MRLPDSAHTSQPWRVHELTPDFRLEDVWALPTPGGPENFPRLVDAMASFNPARTSSAAVRLLFAIRRTAGEVLGLDAPQTGRNCSGRTLRHRLPPDLRDEATSTTPMQGPFTSLYLTADEWALEIVNRTVHGVLHLGWVPDGAGRYRGQMAVLVKPNGLLGHAYMTAIAPWRHRIVYPLMLRDIGEAWADRDTEVGRVRQVAVPASARALSTLSRIDYADAFVLDTGPDADRTAEQWARAVLEDAPLSVRGRLLSGWSAIGLKLAPDRSDSSVLGWPIRDRSPDFVLLGADSRIGMPGELLFKRERQALLFATFVQQENRMARAVWAGVEPVHVPTVRQILEQAGRRRP